MAAESDIMDENTNEDDDGSRFDIGQVLDWMDTSDESELKASRVDGEDKDAHDESQELFGDLGDLVNNTQVDSVITDMGFDVDALDEMGQEAILGVQETIDDGQPKEFGDGYSTIGVRVIEDGHTAILESLQFGDVNQPPSVEELKEVITSNFRITHGWKIDKLNEAIKRAQKRAIWDGNIIIAQATLPEKAEDGRIVYHIPGKNGNEAPVDGTELNAAMNGDDIKATLRVKESPTLVAAEAKIATIMTPQSGKPGLNVFGQEIVNVGKIANRPVAGDGVRLEEDAYIADCVGYICRIDNKLRVLSPLWIDNDRCGARFLYFPQPNSNNVLAPSDILGLLQKADISFGIIESAVEKVCGKGVGSKRAAIAVARGHKRVPGKNSEFIPNFSPENAPEEFDSETVDHRSSNEFIPVAKGDLLGEYVPATTGVAGTDIYGEELPAADGDVIPFTVGAGVNVTPKSDSSVEEKESQATTDDDTDLSGQLIQDQHCLLYSKISGSIRYTGETLEVLPVVVIVGDVDFSVGHVSTKGDVKIGGSVQFGFNITCGGSVEIAGGIENGVTIRAEGDVRVNKSIIGEKTMIISGGNVSARLVHNARVVAQGDVTISHSLVNARVHAGSTITVTPGSGRAGSIVGGESFAAKSIQAKALGSPGMEPTRVGCRPSPQDLAHLSALQAELANNRKIANKCMKWMGIKKFDKKQIDRAFQGVPDDKREAFAKALREGVKAATRLSELPQEISKTSNEHQETINRGQVKASEAFFAEVVIEYGIRETRLLDKSVGGRYVLADDEVRWRPPI